MNTKGHHHHPTYFHPHNLGKVIMMARVGPVMLLVLAGVSAVLADQFVKEYSYMKVMTNCFGEENYMAFKRKVGEATKVCYQQEPTPYLSNHISRETNRPRNQDTSPMYDATYIKWMVSRAESQVSNFTCVMQSLGYLKNDLSLDFVKMEEETKVYALPQDLQNDMIKGLEHCKNFVNCLPAEQHDTPIPTNIKRAMAFLKCDKKIRMKICMKHDIKKYLTDFDVSAIPGVRTGDDNEVAGKLLHIMWGVDTKDDFQLY